MPVFIVTDTNRSIDVTDAANAPVVADAFERLTKRVTDAEASRDAVQAQFDTQSEEVATLRAKCSDAAVSERVQAVSRVARIARKIAGEAFACDSVETTEIQRAALAVVRPNVAWADKSAAYVEAAFDAAEEKADEDEEDETKDAGGKGKQRMKADDSYRQLAQDAALTTPVQDAEPVMSRAEAAYLKRIGKGA